MKCLSCQRDINNLCHTYTSKITYTFSTEDDEASYRRGIAKEESEWKCPRCYATLFHNEKDALEFLASSPTKEFIREHFRFPVDLLDHVLNFEQVKEGEYLHTMIELSHCATGIGIQEQYLKDLVYIVGWTSSMDIEFREVIHGTEV